MIAFVLISTVKMPKKDIYAYIPFLKHEFSKILISPGYAVFLFGSTVRGDATDTSDIDIAVTQTSGQPISSLMMSRIYEVIDELPWAIDLVDTATMRPNFLENMQGSRYQIY